MTPEKTKDTFPSRQLKKKEDAPLATVVVPEGMCGLTNATQDDFSIDRITVIQGTAPETKMYGEHSRGTWVYCSNGVELDIKDLPFVVIKAYNEWIKYKEGSMSAGVEYRTRNIKDVDQKDLVWASGKDGKGFATIQYSNWIVLFEGHDMPVIISFKKTSLKSGQGLNSMEIARKVAAKRRGENVTPGLYCLDVREKEFEGGSALIPTARPMGNPSKEQLEFAVQWFNIIGDTKDIAVKTDVVDEVDDDVTEVPF